MGLFDSVANSLPSAGASIALGLAKKYIPPTMGPIVSAGLNVGGNLLNGDIAGAGLAVLNSGLLTSKFPFLSTEATALNYMFTPTPLFGGITPFEAKQIYQGISATEYARKNLFLVEVSDLSPSDAGSMLVDGDGPGTFNMFVTDVAYSPWTISGEKRRVGSASTDSVHNSEPVDLRISTMDDKFGTIKKWFTDKAKRAGGADGTVGLPADYLIKVRILHGFITNGSDLGGHSDQMLFRPANIEYELSRRDAGLQEIQMTFSQFDTFFPA